MADAQSLMALLDYDPETGVFVWKGGRRRQPGSRAGHKNWCGHRVIGFFGRGHREHRLAWESANGPVPEGFEIDHINGVYDDNRLVNLRLATHQQNLANCKNRKNNTSGRKGVIRHHDGRWRARIMVSGKTLHIGLFQSVEEAGAAYFAAAEKHFGEFARAA